MSAKTITVHADVAKQVTMGMDIKIIYSEENTKCFTGDNSLLLQNEVSMSSPTEVIFDSTTATQRSVFEYEVEYDTALSHTPVAVVKADEKDENKLLVYPLDESLSLGDKISRTLDDYLSPMLTVEHDGGGYYVDRSELNITEDDKVTHICIVIELASGEKVSSSPMPVTEGNETELACSSQ